MTRFKLHFDGGCKPNPGQGYGSYEVELISNLDGLPPNSPKWKHRGELIQFGFMTNSMAEYHAMIHGLKKLRHEIKHGYLFDHGVTFPNCILHLYSDSDLLVNQMQNNYKTKVITLTELKDEARLMLKEFGHWSIHWNTRRKNVARFGH